MKNFKLFKTLLIAIGLLATSLTTNVWAYNIWDAYVYFDNTNSNWDTPTTKSIFFIPEKNDNGTKGSAAVNMSVVTGTKLLYWHGTWGDAKVDGGSRFASCKYNAGGYGFETSESWSRVNGNSNCYGITGTIGENTPDGQYDSWLYISASGTYNNSSAVNLSSSVHLTGGYGDLNFDQIVKKHTADNQSFSEVNVNSGTVTMSAYKMTAHGTASNSSNSATLDDASETSMSIKAVYTGTVTLTASANDGYVFLGWYTSTANDASPVETNTTYTYRAPRSSKTVYARFAPKLSGTLYLKTNGTSGWRTSGSGIPHFDAVFKNASNTSRVTCSSTGVADYYSVNVPEGDWWKVEFERMPPSGTRWNYSGVFYAYGTRNCVKITGWNESAEWCRYAPIPAIAGSMNDWNPVANQFTGTTQVTCSLTLAANKSYTFKVAVGIDGENEWYGFGNEGTNAENTYHTFVGQTGNVTLVQNKCNLRLLSAGAGTYVFTYNTSTHALSIAYPPVNHPNSDYTYFKNTSSWSSPITAHIWGGSAGISTGWGNLPQLPSFTFDGVTYYYFARGDNTTGLFASGTNAPSTKTSDLNDIATAGKGKGRWLNKDTSPYWFDFTQDVTLSPDNGGSNKTIVATYGAAMPSKLKGGSVSVSAPSFSGYTFGGYYKNSGGSGTQYYTNACASAHVWDQTGASPSIYAKWTQDVSLDREGATTGSMSVGVTYKSATIGSITNPEKDNYTFAGWYSGDNGTGQLIINTSGVLQANKTDDVAFTGAGGIWTHTGSAPTLHAGWTENLHSVTVAAGSNGEVSTSSVSDIGVATASGDITAAPNTGYHFTGWELPSGVTAAAGYTSASNPIKINATADSKTITANFAANSYTVVFNANYPSGKRFDNGGSMSNQAFTYDATQALTTNAFACEGYTFAGWATSAERANTGTIDHTNGKSVSNLTTTNGGTVNLYAVWEDDNVYYFDGSDSYWNKASNWTKGVVPNSMSHDVILLKHADINAGDAYRVKSVRIATAGSYTPTGGSEIDVDENGARLYMWYNSSLIIAEDILNIDLSAEPATTAPTTWRSLQLWASAAGTPALIVGNRQVGNKAEVDFYTKACYGGTPGSYVNQFFGIPYTSSSPLNYYGVYLYKYNLNEETYEQSFDPAASSTMTPFTAYLMLRTELTPGYCYTDGELILPGTGEYKEQVLNLIGSSSKKVSNMFANSWVGPIDIRTMETDEDFDGVEPTFYLFNAGSSSQVGINASAGNAPGQWTVLPVEAIKDAEPEEFGDEEDYAQYVIPSQQAFLVVATKDDGDHQLKLDYKKHVYDPAVNNGVTIVPTRAPQRETDYLDRPERIRLNVTGESGNSDKVIIYGREDFSTGYDCGWEGYKIAGSAFAPQLYTMSDQGKMAVNATNVVEGSVVGFKSGTEDDTYTITFKYRGENIWYLNDLKEQTSTLIDADNSYTFVSAEGDTEARFIISASPIHHMPTDISGVGANSEMNVRKQMIDGKLFIIRNGLMYSTDGQLVK